MPQPHSGQTDAVHRHTQALLPSLPRPPRSYPWSKHPSGPVSLPSYPRCGGDLCIISFLSLQGEVPKAEGVLLRQALSGTCASRTPSVAPRRLPLRGGANYSKASAAPRVSRRGWERLQHRRDRDSCGDARKGRRQRGHSADGREWTDDFWLTIRLGVRDSCLPMSLRRRCLRRL